MKSILVMKSHSVKDLFFVVSLNLWGLGQIWYFVSSSAKNPRVHRIVFCRRNYPDVARATCWSTIRPPHTHTHTHTIYSVAIGHSCVNRATITISTMRSSRRGFASRRAGGVAHRQLPRRFLCPDLGRHYFWNSTIRPSVCPMAQLPRL